MLLKETRQKNEKIEKDPARARSLADDFLVKVKRYNEELARKEQIENEIKALQARAVQVAQDIINLPLKGEKNKNDSSKKEQEKKVKKPVVPEPLVHIEKNKSTELFSHTYIAPKYDLDKDEPVPPDTPVAEVDSPAEPEVVVPIKQEEAVAIAESTAETEIETSESDSVESAPSVASETEVIVVAPPVVSVPIASPQIEEIAVSEQSPATPVENVTHEVYYEEPTVSEVEPVIEKVELIEESAQSKAAVTEELPESVTPASVEKTNNESELNLAENKKKVDDAIENVVENLPAKEVRIIEAAMEKEVPLFDESKEVKTNKKTYLINQIVKYFSGKKVSLPMKRIIKTMALPALMTVGVLLSPENKNMFPGQQKGFSKTEKAAVDNQPKTQAGVGSSKSTGFFNFFETLTKPKIDSATFNRLEPLTKEVYTWVLEQRVDSFFITEKSTASFISIGKGGKARGVAPVLIGKSIGEEENYYDPNAKLTGTSGKLTTPAGLHYIRPGIVSEEMESEFKGRIYGVQGALPVAIHTVPPNEAAMRTRALNTPTIEDNRLSSGCINLPVPSFDTLIGPQVPSTTKINGQVHEGALFIIMPDHPELYKFNRQTGAFELKTKNYEHTTSATAIPSFTKDKNQSGPL